MEHSTCIETQSLECDLMQDDYSLVPRPSLTAFSRSRGKNHAFCHGCEKSCEGRPGYEARMTILGGVQLTSGASQARLFSYTVGKTWDDISTDTAFPQVKKPRDRGRL